MFGSSSTTSTRTASAGAVVVSLTHGSCARNLRGSWEEPNYNVRTWMCARRPDRLARQSGYSSLRQARGSSSPSLGARSRSEEWYGATNGSGAMTVYVW